MHVTGLEKSQQQKPGLGMPVRRGKQEMGMPVRRGKQCFSHRCRALAVSKFLREAMPKSKGAKAKRVCATIRQHRMHLIKKAGWRRATEGPQLFRCNDPGTVTAGQEEIGTSTPFPACQQRETTVGLNPADFSQQLLLIPRISGCR